MKVEIFRSERDVIETFLTLRYFTWIEFLITFPIRKIEEISEFMHDTSIINSMFIR